MRWWRDRWLVALVAAFAVVYSALSLTRHATYRSSGFDLGLFDQVVWHLANLEAPASSLKDLDSIFGDHFSPILLSLIPLRAAWPSPEALLVAQATLVAVSAIPVFLFARARLDRSPSLLVALAYLLFGGLQEGVWFDFHEVAFAPLLIGLMVLSADRDRPRAALAWAGVLLLVKEDMAFVVIAFGAYLAVCGHRRPGLAAAIGGVAWYFLTTAVIIPAAAGGVAYRYWSYTQLGHDLPDALGAVARAPWRLVEVAADPVQKIRTTAYLLGAWLGLGFLSPVTLLAIPLLAERMLSTNAQFWSTKGHYSMAIAPVLALGAADGLARLSGWTAGSGTFSRRLPLLATGAVASIAVVAAAAFPLHRLFTPGFYRTPDAYRAADAALVRIPDGASVAASNRIVPHLADRDRITVLGPSPPAAKFVVAALDDPSPAGVFPNRDQAGLRRLVSAARERYTTVFERDGILVLRRRP